MSEQLPGESHGNRAKLAAEIGGGALGIASASVGAYMLWRKRKTEARTFSEIQESSELIFEEERLTSERRELMAKLAVRVYQATIGSSNGVITRSELVDNLGTKKHAAQKMLSYLMPADSTDDAKAKAYIDRRPGTIDGVQGYYAQPRLIQLVEVGASPTLDQAMLELVQPQAEANDSWYSSEESPGPDPVTGA